MHHALDFPRRADDGRNSVEICPAQLDLVTGLVDDHRATLDAAHEAFGLFLWAWEQQDRWTLDEHRGFWTGALRLWPARPGRRSTAEATAFHLRALRHEGHSDDSAAQALGYAPDDLRRTVSRARAVRDFGEGVVTDYVLPRIWTDEDRGAAPDPDAHPNIDEPDRRLT